MKAQRLKLLGHIVRMDDKRMVKSITDWKPLGKKAKGKTRKRWMDGWTDGRTDGRTDRWMDDWMDG